MGIGVTVPRLGWTMETGTLVEWFKRDGDDVRVGDPLFALEGDKATETVEAIDAGTLRLAADGPKAGDKVSVGQVVAHLIGADESVAARGRVEAPAEAPAAPPPVVTRKKRSRPVTPRALRIAQELSIDVAALRGSGANGRVRERDVRAAAGASPRGRTLPVSAVRQTIAARMVSGVTRAAPVTLTVKVDATNLVNLRAQYRAAAGGAPSVNVFLLSLTARVLTRHAELQAQWQDDGLFYPEGVHLAFGVDTDAGLFAPVLRDADRRSLAEVARETGALIARAREGRLSSDDQRGATFTVTNLGMFGVDAFTPIISLPQCAALGVGRIVSEPAVVNQQIVPRDALTLSLTFDHRVVDGAPAARFLDAVRRAVENPAPFLIAGQHP